MELTYRFTNKEVTPWGGMVFLKQFLGKMGFSECVSACECLPQPGSNRGYRPSVLLESFVCSVWCGATRFVHTELTRLDRALGKIFGWVRVPAQDAYKRFSANLARRTICGWRIISSAGCWKVISMTTLRLIRKAAKLHYCSQISSPYSTPDSRERTVARA